MKIDLLYFNDCPSWKVALENLETALAAESVEAEIQLIEVVNRDQAASLKFLGSPSFCVNGQDWWPEVRETYNLSCRVYGHHVILLTDCERIIDVFRRPE